MPQAAPRERAPAGAVAALGVVLAAAAFLLVMPAVMAIVPGKVLPRPFPEQHQRGETLVYLLTFGVLLPAGVLAGRSVAGRLRRSGRGAELPALTGLLAAALAALLVAVKALGRAGGPDGIGAVFAAGCVWWLAAGLAVWRLRPPARSAAWAWGAAAAATGVLLLGFTLLGSIDVGVLVVAALAAAAAVAVYGRLRVALPGRWGLVADAVVLVALLVLIPDLVIFEPETPTLAARLTARIIQFHHNFLLGPANEVLHGRPMLAGTASQYGVTSILALVAFFHVAPIGYGTFGLLSGALTALWFCAGYLILRLAGTARWLSAGALAVGVVALVYNLVYPVGAIPQDGPLRFGMPMLLVLFAVAAEHGAGPAWLRAALVPAVLGLASVWSFEALGFTGLTFAAVIATRALLAPAGVRRRCLVRQALAGVAACVAAHLLFAAIMLAATGDLPQWGHYVGYIREFLGGSVGDLTYDVERWTPAFAVAGLYVASAAGAAELLRRGEPVRDADRPAVVAITGMTAYGVALLSYFVNRSLPNVLIDVALPALLLAVLWLGLLLRRGPAVPLALRRSGLAAVLAVGVLVLAVAWSGVGPRVGRTPLGRALPGGVTLGASLHRLWHPPPVNPSAPLGQAVLARYMPGERRSLVMVSPDLGVEILLRSDRADALHLGDPWESSFVPDEERPVVRRAVDGLRPGRRMLLDAGSRAALTVLRRDAGTATRKQLLSKLAPLQQFALRRIDRRFRLRPVGPQDGPLSVVELTARA